MKPEACVRELRDVDPVAQAATLAAAIAADLSAALTRRSTASLVVSGGRTPAAMFEQLAGFRIDWPRVQITLADERWVNSDDAASNERLVRTSLLRDAAKAAKFVGMKNSAVTPAAGAEQAWAAIAAMAQPFDVVVLGIGDDGHMASLFPGSVELAAGLDARAGPGCLAVDPMQTSQASQASQASHARLSLNLAALLRSRRICIQICGALKWQVYERARAAGPVAQMPIRAVLRQREVPVDVYWCPQFNAELAR